ncbi:iron-containing alcohol dehydrogenase [Paenibacillus sp. NPDC058071]|uniref:iron-containing alcohol dehydrogenase n=1 Tax=Paenibacillus sp. NPDC058071 TaxID=3346326 RepID=UPI0036DDC2E9
MKGFTYYNPAKIIFGRGSEQHLEELLRQQGTTSLLLVYSGDFVKTLGIFDTVKNICANLGITFYENGQVVPNPKIELVYSLVEQSKQNKIDFVLAAGGGSAIDTAKAVAIGVPYEDDVWDFFTKGIELTEALPIGVITTLPASGSETSNCTIISNGLYKLGFEHDLIIPQFAIMNPEFTLGLPAYQTSCGIADILSHLLERYFSDVEHTDVTDFMLEGAMKALLINGERLIDNPANYNARAEIQWLASVAHNNILDTGRISDWGSHRIEHELSAQYGVTHGEGMAVVLVAWTKYAANQKPRKLAQLANRLYGIDYHSFSEKQMALKLSEELRRFFKMLNLKTTLTELGIGTDHFEEMANRATKNDTQRVGHYMELDRAKILEILSMALA